MDALLNGTLFANQRMDQPEEAGKNRKR